MNKDGKMVVYGEEARHALKKGLDAVANAVSKTLGPRGRTAVLSRMYGGPLVTKDGVTVANEVSLSDPLENEGSTLCKQVASKTNDIAGDGTTTATVLAQAIVTEGLKQISAGWNPLRVKRGIDQAVNEIIKLLEDWAIPVENLDQIKAVAAIAGNDPKIGEDFGEIYKELGNSAVISVEKGKSMETQIKFEKGMQIDKGYVSPFFVGNSSEKECVLQKPLILLIERNLSSISPEGIKFLEMISSLGKPLLIIADQVSDDFLSTLVINKLRGVLDCCAIQAPAFGERRKAIMQDIAVLTGGQFISEDLGLGMDKITPDMLGKADEVIVTDLTTTIKASANSEDVQKRIEFLKKAYDESESSYDKEKLMERIAKLSSGVATIKVGAPSESELNEIKDRYVDAVGAVRSALEEGVTAGGGSTLLRISNKLLREVAKEETTDEVIGKKIVYKAIQEPFRRIIENAGKEPAEIMHEVLSFQEKSPSARVGYNAMTDEIVEDMVSQGIVDPVKVTKSALRNAASIAGTILMTEVLVVEPPKEEREP